MSDKTARAVTKPKRRFQAHSVECHYGVWRIRWVADGALQTCYLPKCESVQEAQAVLKRHVARRNERDTAQGDNWHGPQSNA